MKTGAPACAEIVAEWAAGLSADAVPEAVRIAMRRSLVDCLGLMVAARNEDYVRAVVASCDAEGPCTAVGHAGGYAPADAMLIGGTAIHGEDFDDTFEGTPVHVGAVMVPALIAAAEARRLDGASVLRGLAVGSELVCRLALVAPTAMHRQGFHPTAICGAFGAAAGLAAAMGLKPQQIASAIGIVGSMASGIIEYLAEGTWTKRMHPGWAAQAGWRAARMAENGFLGPRTVFEGQHGAFQAFAVREIEPDFSHLSSGWGERWEAANLALKPYACGTMIQPFIDCAIALRDEIGDASAVARVTAKVGEATVHRLWEPRPEKIAPSTPYSAKFSVPFGVATAFVKGAAGLEEFGEAAIADPAIRELSAKVYYEIDPANEYPKNYTGELLVELKDGRTLSAAQPHLRGGRHAPLDEAELAAKFLANARYGGWPEERSKALAQFAADLFDRSDVSGLRVFSG
ncbi:MAG TPA: MmgE/PrpD family protein [Afifellaceae bacterium]|nr:MmgE/PrpD family protein [Afifellaceae bacterium]